MELLFLPTYSSHLNPIERVWNTMKKHWMDRLAEKEGRMKQEDLEGEVADIINSRLNNVANYWRAAHGDMIQLLQSATH